jgi:hypothetical protein
VLISIKIYQGENTPPDLPLARGGTNRHVHLKAISRVTDVKLGGCIKKLQFSIINDQLPINFQLVIYQLIDNWKMETN